jgi:gliding motility-associated lipoprotein GldD
MIKTTGIRFCLLLLSSTVLSGCNEVVVSKPRGYFRITAPPPSFSPYKHPCGPQFDVPSHAKIEVISRQDTTSSCWFNVSFPSFSAKLHCTLVQLNSREDFISMVDDSHHLAFSHEAKASGIQTHAFHSSENAVSGVTFDLDGPVASPFQFFASDSTAHFLRGSLYFQHIPNPDSLQPSLDYLRKDIVHMIETLQWQ